MTVTAIRPTLTPAERLQRVRDDINLIDVALEDAHGWGETLQQSRATLVAELAGLLAALGQKDELRDLTATSVLAA
jgi:hypothetical protein